MSRAPFPYGACRRNVCIRLPPEDPHAACGEFYGRLLKAMHGARDAPQVWQDHFRGVTARLGFTESKL
eukprot:2573366-Lingulodinium_polyedra.AAC.1